MYTKRLLMIGAGFLQTFMIKKARELGYDVLSVDGNPKAEGFLYSNEFQCIDITDQEKCLAYAQKKRIDGVMTAATDYGVLTSSYIAQKMNLPGLKYSTAKRIKNKYQVRKILFESNVDDTSQTFEISSDTNLDILKEKIEFPVMVKPSDGSGSRGASKVSEPEGLEQACESAILNSLTRKAVVESFIEGREFGVESFVENGKIHVLSVLKKWMTDPPYYAEIGHAIPSGLSEEVEQRIKKCVKHAIEVLDINFGAVNMDLLLTEKQTIHIVDIGARMGGNLIGSHLIPVGTGVDYPACLIKAAVGDSINMCQMRESIPVATRLLALKPGIVLSVPDLTSIERKFDVKIFPNLHVGDEILFYRTNLDGCGYVVATAERIEKAAKKAEDAKRFIDENIRRK